MSVKIDVPLGKLLMCVFVILLGILLIVGGGHLGGVFSIICGIIGILAGIFVLLGY